MNRGITLLDCSIGENTPRKKERLNSSLNWFDILLLSNFNIFVGIPLATIAFQVFRDEIILLISASSADLIKKELMSILERNSWNFFLGNLIEARSNAGSNGELREMI